MPCYDSRSDMNSREGYELARQDLLDEWTHNSPVAEMLCDLMRQHETAKHKPVYLAISPALAKWWEAHLRRDQARQKATVSAKAVKDAKAKALAKLSPAERELLGLRVKP